MKFILVSLLLFATTGLSAQITTGRVKWKSASNLYYTYTGELKNGKPHGRGYAISQEGAIWIQVLGEFKDGMIDGSTVIRHSTGKILVAPWKENKPEGRGVLITPGQDIEYGNFVTGKMEGKVTKIYYDNTISLDNIINGASNGRVVSINSKGNIISDIIYVNGEANGPGYQYEVENKQRFEGIWENGIWVRASTGNYPSFMRSSRFRSSVTNEAILISSNTVRKDNSEVFQDTCFSYDLKNNNRWFGYYDQGEFRSGVRVFGDSDRLIGQTDDKGDQGYCVWYRKGQNLQIGNYKDHKLDGHGITIDIDDSTIYDGMFSDGSYTGSASRLMKNKEIQIGNFIAGKLDGEGKVIFPDGRSVSGTYDKGRLTNVIEITNPDGKKIDMNPKDISSAINFLLKEWENNFSTINSGVLSGTLVDRNQSWYSVLGGSSIIITGITGMDGKPHNEFSAEIKKSSDYNLIKNEYDALCKKLSASAITSLQKGKVIKLVPKLKQQKIDPESNRMATLFDIPAYNGKTKTALIRVMVEEKYDKSYLLTLDIISK